MSWLLLLLIVNCVSLDLDDDDDDFDEEEEEETEEPVKDEEAEEEEREEVEEEEQQTEVPGEDTKWVSSAVRDVAYYLRAHKFNDFDRRYHTNEDLAPRNLYREFPDPPLRALHWQVRKYCEPGFLSCLHYLHQKVLSAEFQRSIDPVYSGHGSEQECERLRRLDWVGAQPFLGPLERFQWRTSASYYMCWFAMNTETPLSHFEERCDNFANCLDPDFNDSNKDPRASSHIPYQCATYSFCPDPCCPRKHYFGMDECHNADSNPCLAEAPHRHHMCSFNFTRNTDFVSIVLNRWNVSCTCKDPGYEWDSRFGMCVDIDECMKDLHTCDTQTEACFNLPGSYECGCRWGYLYDHEKQECVQNRLLHIQSEPQPEMLIQEGKPGKLYLKFHGATCYEGPMPVR